MNENVMPMFAPQKRLDVYAKTVHDFFTHPFDNVALPDYQRPYVWSNEKIEQLLQDWSEHFFIDKKFNANAPYYYLGTVLFYENGTSYEIIDGQQRITTLLLIDQFLKKDSSYLKAGKWDLNYNSLLSSANIKKNFNYLNESEYLGYIKDQISDIFEKIILTIIITDSEDEAFTFFDSQNSRGVSLDAVDFLKSYHLRELKDKIELQKKFVKQWDSNNSNQFLNELFSKTLWRARNWKGIQIQFENKDLILKSFQKDTLKEDENEVLRLYSNVNNLFASSLIYDADYGIVAQPKALNMQMSADLYPFALRQPIQKGIGFFLYAEKYFAIYKLLFVTKKVLEVTNISDNLIKSFNDHFKSFYELAIVVYYDKFKEEKILEFTLWLDFLLGAVRVNQASIVAQTPVKILRGGRQNFLDVIQLSYKPEEVFEFIRKMEVDGQNINYFYKKGIDDYGSIHGVRNQYRKDNLDFFKKVNTDGEEELINKKKWIHDIIK